MLVNPNYLFTGQLKEMNTKMKR